MALFVNTFTPGDKIYGLASPNVGRNRYTNTNEFRQRFGHLDFTTDQLNNRFLGTGFLDGPAIYFSALMSGIEGIALNITPQQAHETDQFRLFLEKHPKQKYRPSVTNSLQDRNLRISRACKAALEFITVKCGRRIHFILDDIDLDAVMRKTPHNGGAKSITGQELRFIYRNCVVLNEEVGAEARPIDEVQKQMLLFNRTKWSLYQKRGNTRRMLQHITFWYQGVIVSPPWADGLRKDMWFESYGRFSEDKAGKTQARNLIKKIDNEFEKNQKAKVPSRRF